MNRRQALRTVAGGSMVAAAGCLFADEPTEPFNFAIVNRRRQRYAAEFTLRDGSDDVIVDGSVDIPPRPPADEEQSKLVFNELVQVSNGDTVAVQIEIDGESFEETYEITCVGNDNAENNFVFRIRHPEAPSSNGMEFAGSEC